MDAGSPARERKSFLDVLVGIEVGLMGGLAMLLWFVVISPVIGYGWWFIPNLFASYFYSQREVLFGPGIVTWVGAAVHLLASGLLGAINGILTPGGRLFGLAVAMAWYLLCYFVLWKRSASMLVVAPQSVMMAAYFLFGSTLGWHPHVIAYTLGRPTEPKTPVS